MIKFNEDADWVRIVSIDPGTNSCGLSVIALNIQTGELKVEDSYTVFGKDVLRSLKEFKELHGEREAKLYGYFLHFQKVFERVNPVMVVAETSFKGRFANVIAALREQLACIRMAVWLLDRYLPFKVVMPNLVKAHVKVKGTSKDKDLMTKALRKRTDISYSDHLNIDDLDEHSIDSICVGLYFLDEMSCSIREQRKRTVSASSVLESAQQLLAGLAEEMKSPLSSPQLQMS